jgi:hypothetical protein
MFEQDVKTFLVAIGYLSILYVLVRPGSLGPQIVISVATGFGNMIRAATGQQLVPMPNVGSS